MATDADTAAAPLHAGDPRRLGAYELIGRLGSGGQGAVFLAAAPDGRRVAVKLLHPDQIEDTMARERFVREAHAAKRVARFCAAQVLDADVEGDRPYIVSEYVSGPSLYDLVAEKGPINGAALERLAIGTATALVAIHQAGIVHRDLKPGNVLVAPDGPRVIDFGIAKALDGASTMSSRIVGTPAYMAPEQLSGAAIAPAVDVFAWGATMVFVATGRAPFGMDSIPMVVNRIINGQPELGGMSGPVRDLVADCLAKDPQQRPTARQILLRLLGQEDASLAVAPQGPAVPVEEEVLLQGATMAAASTNPRTNPRPPATEQVAPYVESTWTRVNGPNAPFPQAAHHEEAYPQQPAYGAAGRQQAAHQQPAHQQPAYGAVGSQQAYPRQPAYGGVGSQQTAHQQAAYGAAGVQQHDQMTQPPVVFHTPAAPARRSNPGLRRRAALACTGGVLAAAAVGFFAMTALGNTSKEVKPTSVSSSSSAPAQGNDSGTDTGQYGGPATTQPHRQRPASSPSTTPSTPSTGDTGGGTTTDPYPSPSPSAPTHTPTTEPSVTPTDPPTDPAPKPSTDPIAPGGGSAPAPAGGGGGY